MRVLMGEVTTGYGIASRALKHVTPLIERRSGLQPLVRGTLNLRIPEPYIVRADFVIQASEYNRREFLKIQRCRIVGMRALVMRPNTHEEGQWHGPAHLELWSTVVLREVLGLVDGDAVCVELEGVEGWWSS